MTTVPLHPALVHVPLGLAFILPLLASALAVALWRGAAPRRTWLVVVALQAVLLVAGAAAMKAGERDEKRVESVTGEQAIEAHEEAAEVFLWGAGAVLAIAALATVVPARAAATAAGVAALGTFVVAGLAYRTGKAGGELVYARGAAAAYTAAGPAQARIVGRDTRQHDDD